MEITLMELLDAREDRVRKQEQLQKKYNCPLICFTMNIAGPVKTSKEIIRAFRFGLSALEDKLQGFEVLEKNTEYLKSGPVAFFSVLGSAKDIKKLCIEIEDSCTLGRLFDIDVLDIDGTKIERLSERHCIICHKKGRSCVAGRLHSVEELQSTTKRIINNHFAEYDSIIISNLARNSLIDEVLTTPKPGLVDRANNGSHGDMNVESFIKSADALFPYFKKCFKTGIESSACTPGHTFNMLRQRGVLAEKDMYSATDGVNTHKGIIYSMGIILGALGRLWTPAVPFANIDDILIECSALVKESVVKDFASIDKSTAGGRLYLFNGEKGIRGEASLGFPSVKNISIPTYKKYISEGKNKNDAGVIALLHLISNIYDSAIYNRGGEDGVDYARKYAQNILLQSTLTNEDVEKMDRDFISKNLSPGGAADLLAITYFLAELETVF